MHRVKILQKVCHTNQFEGPIHTFGKGLLRLYAHFSVCAVHLYCYRGPLLAPWN